MIACDLRPPPEQLHREAARAPGEVDWVQLDVTRPDAWRGLPADTAEVVVHAAAVTPGDDDQTPHITSGVNLQGSLCAMEWAREHGIRRFLFVSSSAVYRGAESRASLREGMPLDPPTTYGIAKLAAERFAALYRRRGWLDVISIRLPSLYGPWERPSGVRPSMSPVYRLVRAAVFNEELRVTGIEIPRDWTYAPEAADGLVHLAGLDELPDHDCINLSTGAFVSLEAVVHDLTEAVGEVPIHPVSRAEGADLVMTPTSGERPMDVSRLSAAGFSAGVTTRQGISRYLRWLSDEGRRELCFPHRRSS